MSYSTYIMHILMSLMMMSMTIMMFSRAKASSDRLKEVLGEPDIQDPLHSQKQQVTSGKVEFRHVTFRYEGSSEPILQDISFTVNPRGDCGDHRFHGFRQIVFWFS